MLSSKNKKFLIDKLDNMLKDIFFTDLLAAEKKCDNLINKFNNMEEYVINFINRRIIKIIKLVGLIRAYDCYNLN